MLLSLCNELYSPQTSYVKPISFPGYSSTVSLLWRVCAIAAHWMISWVYFCLFVCGWVGIWLHRLFLWLSSGEGCLDAFSSVLILTPNCLSWPVISGLSNLKEQCVKTCNIYLLWRRKMKSYHFNLLLLKWVWATRVTRFSLRHCNFTPETETYFHSESWFCVCRYLLI